MPYSGLAVVPASRLRDSRHERLLVAVSDRSEPLHQTGFLRE